MMSNHNRRFVGPPIKRKAWENLDGLTAFKKPERPSNIKPGPNHQAHNKAITKPAQNNQLLAGYLAHEFLTKGSLFGEPWDPARAEAVPVSADSRRQVAGPSQAKPIKEKKERYIEVADLLKTDKVQLSGVVNPTQLGRYLQL